MVIISGSTFINNSTSQGFSKGGAIVTDGTLTIINSTFYNNIADTRGGAISIESGSVLLRHVTISQNRSPGYGAGIYVGGVLRPENTIIADNIGGNCFVQGGIIVDGGGNLRYPTTDESCVGLYGDPMLSDPALNGGITQTMALQWGSAAIDRIDGANGCGVDVSTDQRGTKRPQPIGWLCDIGAYEKAQGLEEVVDIRCFIATAAFGSPYGKYVTTLRHFRDRFLIPNALGRSFVNWYYEKSPAWASYIARRDGIRKAVRIMLIPAYVLALIALNWDTQATLMMVLIVMMWPMGKRKYAMAGLRFFFRTADKMMKKPGEDYPSPQ